MSKLFDDALEVAKARYRYPINHFEEFEEYFVFDFDDGSDEIYCGGDRMPVVVRKSDLATLSYASVFFDLFGEDEVGDMLREGSI